MVCLLQLFLAVGFAVENIVQCDEFQNSLQTLDSNELGKAFETDEERKLNKVPWGPNLEPEAKMDVVEMIRYNGYPVEEYDIVTEDGYIITIQRIPYGTSGPGNKPRQPVIVQHGMLCTSIIWVFNTPAKSIGFILADHGYDVWLTNVRGNTYGRRHVKLSPKKKEFWEFSFDEMARYDMPAMIDFILSKTGFNQTNYIGHSMGTTIALIMLSEKPEYNNKVSSAMLMAPAMSTQNIRGPLALVKPFVSDIQFIVNLVGGYEVVPYSPLNEFLSKFSSAFCNSNYKQICSWLPILATGFNDKQFNVTRFPVYSARTPGGASVQTIMHYAQLMRPGFRRYNYSQSKNMQKYGQTEPPMYDISNIKVPIAIFWAESDYLTTPKDIHKIATQISNLFFVYKVPLFEFTHEDFVFAMNVKSLVYDKVIETMETLWRDE